MHNLDVDYCVRLMAGAFFFDAPARQDKLSIYREKINEWAENSGLDIIALKEEKIRYRKHYNQNYAYKAFHSIYNVLL